MYTRNHRVHNFGEILPDEVIQLSYPYLLKKAGYVTGCLGKFGFGINDQTLAMFDYWNAWEGQGQYFHEIDGKRVHNSQWLADRSIEFLKETNGKPFCLTVNYKVPHHDWLPDPRDEQLFKENTIYRMPSDQEEYFDLLPDTVKNSYARTCFTDLIGIGKYQEWARQYLRCIASLDRSVGEIMDYLVSTDLYRNTVIIFLSDHGHFFGEHQISGKWLLFEESIRIPFIVYDPRLDAKLTNKKKEEMVLNIDVAPTILDMAGITIPSEMNGKSLKGLINGTKQEWRDYIFMEHHYFHRLDNYISRSEGIRTMDWKYFKYVDPDPDIEVLYNLKTDPYEVNDLSKAPEHAEIIKELRWKLDSINHMVPNTYIDPFKTMK
jgi:arylsulfatase A-like enzyme